MKGILLAGGAGTRLHPLTKVISKQLLPIYDKPMIYYPLSVLMLARLRDVLVISTPLNLPLFRRLLGDGSRVGLHLSYAEQAQPGGIAQALLVAQEFLAGEPACLVLGDNIFHGHGLTDVLEDAAKLTRGARVFGYWVRDPERYGVVEFGHGGKAISLEEKPRIPRSRYAVPGLYFYGAEVCQLAALLRPSARGELEITDLNRIYLERDQLSVTKLGRGIAWLDTGTHRSLAEATAFVQAIEERQGLKVACIEEIAWNNGWIDSAQLRWEANAHGQGAYGDYLRDLLARGDC